MRPDNRFTLHRLWAIVLKEFIQMRRDWSVVCLLREDGDYPIRSHVLAAGEAGTARVSTELALPREVHDDDRGEDARDD